MRRSLLMRRLVWLWLPVLFSQIAACASAPCDKNRFTVAIDVGHTLAESGALSARGVPEFQFNRRLALRLRQTLSEHGFSRAFLINPDGENISLYHRTHLAREGKADVLLSVHHDSVQPHYLRTWVHDGVKRRYSDRFAGYSLFVSAGNPARAQSLKLARSLGTALRRNGFTPTLHHAEKIEGENREPLDHNLGIYRFDELAVLRTASMPAVLIENGVIVNREEELRLRNADYQRRLAWSVSQGLEVYCRGVFDQ